MTRTGKREMKMKDKAFLSSLLRSIAPNSLPGLLCLISQNIQIHSIRHACRMHTELWIIFSLVIKDMVTWGRWQVMSNSNSLRVLPFLIEIIEKCVNYSELRIFHWDIIYAQSPERRGNETVSNRLLHLMTISIDSMDVFRLLFASESFPWKILP